MKKLIATLLILIMTVSVSLNMTACGGDSKTSENQNQNQNQSNGENKQDGNISAIEEETQNPRFSIRENIPDDLDFADKKFNILYPQWSMYQYYYFAESEIGEKMNDAIYRRTKNVEERFNITINPITYGDIFTIPSSISKSVRSGSDDYQLALAHCVGGIIEMTTGGLVENWNKVPIVDFTKPWWNQRMNQTLSIDHILLTAVSDFIIFDPNVIYFNKRMAQDLGIGDMYQLVRDGKWTWPKLTELAKLASKDLNGDGLFDVNDQYGFVIHLNWMLESTPHSANIFIAQIGDEGYPVNNLMSERFGTLINTLHDLIFVGNQTFIGDWDSNAPESEGRHESQVPMSSDRVLFHVDPLSAGKRYRVYDVEFGILPYPKLDEAQKEYLSLSFNGFMMIPRTADLEFTGAVSEALSAESYRLTVPAYYDIVLTSKVARDDESAEMIDIIYKGAVYDFGFNFGNWEPLTNAVLSVLQTKSTDYVSYIEKNEAKFNKHMRTVYDKIRDKYAD